MRSLITLRWFILGTSALILTLMIAVLVFLLLDEKANNRNQQQQISSLQKRLSELENVAYDQDLHLQVLSATLSTVIESQTIITLKHTSKDIGLIQIQKKADKLSVSFSAPYLKVAGDYFIGEVGSSKFYKNPEESFHINVQGLRANSRNHTKQAVGQLALLFGVIEHPELWENPYYQALWAVLQDRPHNLDDTYYPEEMNGVLIVPVPPRGSYYYEYSLKDPFFKLRFLDPEGNITDEVSLDPPESTEESQKSPKAPRDL